MQTYVFTAKEMRDVALSGGKCNRTHPAKRKRRNLMARVRRTRRKYAAAQA